MGPEPSGTHSNWFLAQDLYEIKPVSILNEELMAANGLAERESWFS